MISISRLYCDTINPSDLLRYGRKAGKLPAHMLHYSEDKKPIVVFNCTKRCNLKCVHCYSQSTGALAKNELTTDEAKAVITGLPNSAAP